MQFYLLLGILFTLITTTGRAEHGTESKSSLADEVKRNSRTVDSSGSFVNLAGRVKLVKDESGNETFYFHPLPGGKFKIVGASEEQLKDLRVFAEDPIGTVYLMGHKKGGEIRLKRISKSNGVSLPVIPRARDLLDFNKISCVNENDIAYSTYMTITNGASGISVLIRQKRGNIAQTVLNETGGEIDEKESSPRQVWISTKGKTRLSFRWDGLTMDNAYIHVPNEDGTVTKIKATCRFED